jgi:hypothetical protein
MVPAKSFATTNTLDANRCAEGAVPQQRADHARFAARVEALLHDSPYLALRKIKCEFDGESIFLRGRVPTFYTKQVAFTLVERLDPAVEIVDQIEVVPPKPRKPKPR